VKASGRSWGWICAVGSPRLPRWCPVVSRGPTESQRGIPPPGSRPGEGRSRGRTKLRSRHCPLDHRRRLPSRSQSLMKIVEVAVTPEYRHRSRGAPAAARKPPPIWLQYWPKLQLVIACASSDLRALRRPSLISLETWLFSAGVIGIHIPEMLWKLTRASLRITKNA